MSTLPGQITVTLNADTRRAYEAFAEAARRAAQAITDLAPILRHVKLAQSRHRSRVVTRRKQRRHW